ncbi:uncharacterized protein LOC128879554 isoform X2 [Hylaeus volcanicus]|uniref:uncharacterized protein LOC128879554 isoform X2 n=1 Tax=Hylaeus volcanicus TaxID=313075 RepID=UPI0023B7D500|nr:uncharacterized protein LOC128879554 isoform X2 [Hylaeus volcanicus]
MWILLPIVSLLVHSIVGKPAIRGALSDLTQLDKKSNGLLYNWGERSVINASKRWKDESFKAKRTKRQSEQDVVVSDEREENSNFDNAQDSERFNYNRATDSNVRIVERKRKGTGSWFKRLVPEFDEFPSRENNDLIYGWGDVKMRDRKPIRQLFYPGNGKREKSDSSANILNRTVREKSEKKHQGFYMWSGKRADQELDRKRFILMVEPSPIGANISGIMQDGIASEEEIGRIANKNNVARKKSILRINNENDYAQREEVANNDNDWLGTVHCTLYCHQVSSKSSQPHLRSSMNN